MPLSTRSGPGASTCFASNQNRDLAIAEASTLRGDRLDQCAKFGVVSAPPSIAHRRSRAPCKLARTSFAATFGLEGPHRVFPL